MDLVYYMEWNDLFEKENTLSIVQFVLNKIFTLVVLLRIDYKN